MSSPFLGGRRSLGFGQVVRRNVQNSFALDMELVGNADQEVYNPARAHGRLSANHFYCPGSNLPRQQMQARFEVAGNPR